MVRVGHYHALDQLSELWIVKSVLVITLRFFSATHLLPKCFMIVIDQKTVARVVVCGHLKWISDHSNQNDGCSIKIDCLSIVFTTSENLWCHKHQCAALSFKGVSLHQIGQSEIGDL